MNSSMNIEHNRTIIDVVTYIIVFWRCLSFAIFYSMCTSKTKVSHYVKGQALFRGVGHDTCVTYLCVRKHCETIHMSTWSQYKEYSCIFQVRR